MTTSPPSSSDQGGRSSAAFERLHEKVRRWIWEKKWTDLQDIQEAAVDPILAASVDLIISAGTARGKTEAAFLPICSTLVGRDAGGVSVLYIGPLKALINDQFERLDDLCRQLEVPVHRWHGDVDAERKKRLLQDPAGILLITPESLEALFVVHGPRINRVLAALSYVVVDELHSFIGTERGRQLLSLLHRVEVAIRRRVPRIGLSATLGDMRLAAEYLRPGGADRVRIIRSDSEGQAIQLQLRGYRERAPRVEDGLAGASLSETPAEVDEPAGGDEIAIAEHVFRTLRGSDNLIFTNRRRDVELYADRLRRFSEHEHVPNEFWPHHGSLSKEVREEVEAMLKDRSRPLSVVCTSTLEMGIDIGSVKSIAQIGCPPSVASLRQRLGRSGRRGDPAILRIYVQEPEVTSRTPPQEALRAHLVQVIAMVRLLLARWCEPPDAGALHLSTLVQQILSLIAQHGGVAPVDVWRLLCHPGPFTGIDQRAFGSLLRDLGKDDLITQAPDGTLVLGLRGERAVNHFSFYTAFTTPEEYRLVTAGRTLGTLPVMQPLAPGLLLIFAGKRWRILEFDEEARVVHLVASAGGRAPLFSGAGCLVHGRVRQEMQTIYLSTEAPAFLDAGARSLLSEGRDNFLRLGLAETPLIAHGEDTLLFPWAGDRVNDTLLFQLRARHLAVSRDGIAITVAKTAPDLLSRHLREMLEQGPADALKLARDVSNKRSQKWDAVLGEELLARDFASRSLDPVGAWECLRRTVSTLPESRRAMPVTRPARWADAPVHVCWSMEDVLDLIESMPVAVPLPLRTVVTPRAAVSHALRRALASRGSHGMLIGTRFISFVAQAKEILQLSGVRTIEGEERLRRSRLRRLFRGGALALGHFPSGLLTETPGWDEAFARAIDDLEWAGYRPEDLGELDDNPAARDLRACWERLDAEADSSWTAARLVIEASRVLEREPDGLRVVDTVLVLLEPAVTAGVTRFVRAIPGAQLVFLAARPLRRRFLARIERLLGAEAANRLAQSSPARQAGSDRDILASCLFEPAEVQGDPCRPRAGAARDGTVVLEDHAGVDSELEAAAAWVARQVLEHGTPLEEIAILVPTLDPLAALIRDRLAELPSPNGALPVYVAGGVPLTSLTGGARLVGVVRALREHLSADALADVLPMLRMDDGDASIPRGAAVDLAHSLGTAGGHRRHPEGGLEWSGQAKRLAQHLERQLCEAADLDDEEARIGPARRTRDLERQLRQLRAVRPALDGLTALAQTVLSGADLGSVWCALRRFVVERVVNHPAPPHAEVIDAALTMVCADARCFSICGQDALELIEEILRNLRIRVGQLGEPAVWVGAIASAVGLRFRAVRIIGLSEGTVPSLPREDPVLPESLRNRLSRAHIDTTDDVSLGSLHALDTVVRHAQRVAFSAPRMGLDRSYREPSSVFLEVAAALGRPGSAGLQDTAPSLDTLFRREFQVARNESRSYRLAHPICEADWQDRIAAGLPMVPSHWTGHIEVDLARIETLCTDLAPGPMDGLLGACDGKPLPGLTPERPISPTTLRTLLECPHRFLYEQVLGWQRPASPRPQHELDSLAFGNLFHRVVERFLRTDGPSFSSRQGDLQAFQERALDIARHEFAVMLEGYPLSGDAVREQQFDRCRRQLRDWLEYEWTMRGPSRFVATEQPFGFIQPVAIRCGDESLYVRGIIDLIEVSDGRTLVRDLKTGACHPRRGEEEKPVATLDAQLAVYGAVAGVLAPAWGVPQRVAVGYVHTDDRSGRERAFVEDYAAFDQSAQRWFELAARLLRARLFPRTPSTQDCLFCPFAPVCGPNAQERAAAVLHEGTEPLLGFAAIKS